MKIGKQLRGSKTKIIDLGGDYRFKDYHVFEQWYKVKHEDPEAQAVYGLTELSAIRCAGRSWWQILAATQPAAFWRWCRF